MAARHSAVHRDACFQYLKPGLSSIRLTQLRDIHIERLSTVLALVGAVVRHR